jgi:dTDP-4-amino-4,6-dideoxygalactose transaminase
MTDIGYNIKYVAKHGRAIPKDPFSIREVGVYQHFSSSTQQCNWVLLQASDQLKDRLRRAFQFYDDTLPPKQFLLHSMILLDASEDWREYLIYLEEEFSKLVNGEFRMQKLC